MDKNKILNIVEFSVADKVGEKESTWTQAAVFYADGTVEIKSMEEAERLSQQQSINIQHSTTQEIENNYQNYRKIANYHPFQNHQENSTDYQPVEEETSKNKSNAEEQPASKIVDTPKRKEKKTIGDKLWNLGKKIPILGYFLRKNEDFCRKGNEKLSSMKENSILPRKERKSVKAKQKKPKERIKKNKKKGFLRKAFTTATLALTMVLGAIGITSCSKKTNPTVQNDKSIEFQTNDLTTYTDEEIKELLKDGSLTEEQIKQLLDEGRITTAQIKELLTKGIVTNDILNNLSFEQLLEVTSNETQKQEMQKIGNYLDYYNKSFADVHLEEEHTDIKAVLKWEEVSAINLAYNDFTNEEIKSMFNGYNVDSWEFTNAYKEATLQLMGAFVLETRDTPVGLDQLLNTQEAKDFYNKYDELWLRCLETTGQEQIDAINAFHEELYKDYPISDDIIEIGISHAETRDDIESYKLSITPMVAAAEMMFQNLETDYTLSDKAIINYFNNLGLCNFAQGTFEKAEQLTLCANEDEKNPTYKQFMKSKVNELIEEERYYKNDKSRDLSQLDAFQNKVNWHFNIDSYGQLIIGNTLTESIVTSSYTKSSTTTHTETTTESTSDREHAVNLVGEEAVANAEAQVDAEIAQQNAEAKKQAEEEAEAYRQQLQAQADKVAAEIEKEINQDNQDMQENINNANNQIDKNNQDQDSSNDTQVNEDDFGEHDVIFDDSHSDSQGNQNNSVEDITTNGSGVGEELPDQNVTGDSFDNQSSSIPTESNPEVSTMPDGDTVIIEYEEAVSETPVETYSAESTEEISQALTNEQIVDAMVEEMANNPTAETESEFVYVK